MFNLDQAIAEWRQQMLAAGINTSEVLNELESHLREDVELQTQSGSDKQSAFAIAVQRMGQADGLRQEFKKVGVMTERRPMKRNITILTGLFGMVWGYSMIMPLLGNLHRTGVLRSLTWLLFGIALVIGGGSVAFYGIRSCKEVRGRKLTSICLMVTAAWYLVPAGIVFVTENLTSTERTWAASVIVANLLFFGSCLYFNRLLPAQSAHER